MKLTKNQIRRLVIKELKVIMDDALLPHGSRTKGLNHKDCNLNNRDDHGRNLGYGSIKSDDREGRMTRSHLYKITKYSQSLHNLLRVDVYLHK